MLMKAILAFLIGGFICAVCEFLLALTNLTPARILVGLVSVGILVGALGLYEPLLSLFGTGVSIPLFGFGGAVAGGVRDAVDEMGLLGVFKGPLTAASAGIGVSLFFGLFFSLFFRSRPKRMKK